MIALMEVDDLGAVASDVGAVVGVSRGTIVLVTLCLFKVFFTFDYDKSPSNHHVGDISNHRTSKSKIRSIYGIFSLTFTTKLQPNVRKYTIHGSHGS